MSDDARKQIIFTAGVIIILLALGAALLPMEHGLPGRLIVGLLLIAAGIVESIAAMARRIHKPSAAIAGIATVLAGLRLSLDPSAGFFPVLNMVILWLIVRTAALGFAANRSKPPLRRWFRIVATVDFLLAVMLLAGLPIALIVAGLFGPTSEIDATFAWVLAISFVANGAFLIAAAPVEACERD